MKDILKSNSMNHKEKKIDKLDYIKISIAVYQNTTKRLK